MSHQKRLLKEFQEEINSIIDFCDCSICGYCCKDEILALREPDINRISRHLKLDKNLFLEQYTNYNPSTKEIVLNMPCPFLKENRCTIYSKRPDRCRNFPITVLIKTKQVIVQDVGACALSTHFNEALLEYLLEHFPKEYDFLIKLYDKIPEKGIDNKQVIHPMYSIEQVMYFINWLNSVDNKYR